MNKPDLTTRPDDANPQADDQNRETQRSHGDQQNRSKKNGHTTQIGTGQDQHSGRQRGGGARRQP